LSKKLKANRFSVNKGKKMSYPFIIQGNNIVVVIDNKAHTISKTHITYQKVLDAIKAQDWEAVKDIIEPKKVVLNYGAGNVSIEGDTLYWRGQEFNTSLTERMIKMLQEGFPIEPMVNFMENLMQNPSKRAVTELYGFLEKNSLPITPDGCFLAYKKVRADYLDCHSGTMDNSVGQIVTMERNMVDDNKEQTCSTGLHFCSIDYLQHFGGERTMIVKINPADVVSIPVDYNNAKGRTCCYEVIGELNVNAEDAFTEAVQETAIGSEPVKSKLNPQAAWPFANERNPSAVAGPKTGSTPFYRGYSAGFNDEEYDQPEDWKGANDYDQGYEKGLVAREDGAEERYRYVEPSVAPAMRSSLSGWPMPR
jgi:hypothetical protein